MRRIVTALAPFIVLIFAWVLATRAELAVDAVQSLIMVLPYITALLALFMSVWFQNSNSLYLISFILMTHIFLSVSAAKPPMLLEVVTMASVLLPFNAVWLGFSKERGIVSTYGRNKALIILGQIIWIFINMMGKSSAPIATGLDQAYIGLKAPAMVLYVLAIIVLLASYILKNQYINLVFAAVLLTSIIALYFAHRLVLNSIFVSAIFAIFILAILDISYSLAFYDALTGVLSRRALEQELLKLRNRYSIAMVDLDHFKHINDKYGHDVGDEVLKMVASLLHKTAGHAKVFRYGGEEFVILFSGQGYSEIIPQLERVRKAIERRPFIVRSEDRPRQKPENVKSIVSRGREAINVTVSIGVAQKNDLLKTCSDVIRKADEALYKSKNGGRNCVTKS